MVPSTLASTIPRSPIDVSAPVAASGCAALASPARDSASGETPPSLPPSSAFAGAAELDPPQAGAAGRSAASTSDRTSLERVQADANIVES